MPKIIWTCFFNLCGWILIQGWKQGPESHYIQPSNLSSASRIINKWTIWFINIFYNVIYRLYFFFFLSSFLIFPFRLESWHCIVGSMSFEILILYISKLIKNLISTTLSMDCISSYFFPALWYFPSGRSHDIVGSSSGPGSRQCLFSCHV